MACYVVTQTRPLERHGAGLVEWQRNIREQILRVHVYHRTGYGTGEGWFA